LELAVAALARRHEVRVEKAPERVDDIRRGQLVAVVEAHVALERHDIGRRRWVVQPLGKVRPHAHVAVEVEQMVEDQLMDLLRGIVEADARIEVVRCGGNRDDENIRIRRGPLQAGSAEEQQQKNSERPADRLRPA
jgi:hypothetical protein